jgi:hypothetical protein
MPVELPEHLERCVDEPLTEKELERLRQSVDRRYPYGETECEVRISKEPGVECAGKATGRPASGKSSLSPFVPILTDIIRRCIVEP